MNISWLAWSLVIFLTALVTLLVTAWITGRQDAGAGDDTLYRKPQLSPGPPGAASPRGAWPPLPRAGRFDLEEPFDLPTVLLQTGPYGPFPVDTGPLLILSEQAAANVALEREIRQRCAEAEAMIPPRWRS